MNWESKQQGQQRVTQQALHQVSWLTPVKEKSPPRKAYSEPILFTSLFIYLFTKRIRHPTGSQSETEWKLTALSCDVAQFVASGDLEKKLNSLDRIETLQWLDLTKHVSKYQKGDLSDTTCFEMLGVVCVVWSFGPQTQQVGHERAHGSATKWFGSNHECSKTGRTLTSRLHMALGQTHVRSVVHGQDARCR